MEEVSKHSVHTLVFRSLKRSHDMFIADNAHPPNRDAEADKVKIACKVKDQYGMVQNLTATTGHQRIAEDSHQGTREESQGYEQGYEEIPAHIQPGHPYPNAPGVPLSEHTARQPGLSQGGVQQVLRGLPPSEAQLQASRTAPGIEDIQRKAGIPERIQPPGSRALVAVSSGTKNSAIVPRKAPTMPKPKWHPPWKLYRVISGHLGWVRSIAVEPGNQWFVTGAGDRVIKIWDLASGQLKLSLTGHVSAVRGLAVSPRQPYLFSCGEDKMVKCWDLEMNKVIRHYHGHLSACYALDLHPTIDILATCGRDATIRIWDMRSKACVHTLTGHTNTVASVKCQSAEPQIVSGSHDSTIRLWDLAAGKSRATLTNHKKSVRSVVLHPKLYMMASASPDNLKQWKFPEGNFMQNLGGHNAIVNCLAVNSDNVLVSGGDNGSLHFWDWRSGFNFQRTQAPAQPGSLDSDAGIFAMTFDHSGSRLLTAEGDKTIKIYKEDDEATEETHPLNWKPEILKKKKY
ncbi:pleiotropic regulator 1 [Strongylocentrotus purpuratus]|uniref:Pleiotropic regulator 1 n=1 Tax=Strongylocentrotus purpuratus TaxID=7668 RepID=A0A7M7SWN4_STRPU|nr:pleiotropic regulator 1 [Strongylocentrotus purpuratus]|eukprot:XP_799009.2 PREDICTED: pleiotropic regulator 1 [Strongylocentrotus purpuratus]